MSSNNENIESGLWDGIAIAAGDVELPPQVGTFERIMPEFRSDRDTNEPILDADGSRSRNLVMHITIPGVTDNWEGGVKVQRIRLGSSSWKTFLTKLAESGFVINESPTELVGESFELEVEERKWKRPDGADARWVIHWPKKHIEP